MAVLEAIAVACLPLLSDIEGHTQFFRDTEGTAHYFFLVTDEITLAEKLEALIQDGTHAKFTEVDLSPYELKNVVLQYSHLLEEAVVHVSGIMRRRKKHESSYLQSVSEDMPTCDAAHVDSWESPGNH